MPEINDDLLIQFASELRTGSDLTTNQVSDAVSALLNESVSDSARAEFLTQLAAKGETPAEISAFVQAILKYATPLEIDYSELPGPALDIVGTGGDKLHLFNVSTTALVILAGGGVVGIKHGNRSITSKSGGADVLEELGIRIDLGPREVVECAKHCGAAFIFAQKYHPAFKTVGPVRKQLAARGQTTVFNKLGPLLNPAQPPFQLAGVFTERLLDTYASVLQQLGRERAWVAHCRLNDGEGGASTGADELLTCGDNLLRKVEGDQPIVSDQFNADDLDIDTPELQELSGGDAQDNAEILVKIIEGHDKGPRADVALLNAAAGFVVAGVCDSMDAGLEHAIETVESGKAARTLKAWQAYQP